jgi:hypothetical protein
MNQVNNIEVRRGVDVGYHSSNVHPIDRDGCVGKQGINKLFTFEMVLKIASKIDEKPNIIIKAGENAKWYLKRCQKDLINDAIISQQWRDTSRCIMYIIDWNN